MKWFKEEDLKDVNALRSAYKKLLIKYYPDNNAEDTTAKMQEINAEYDKVFQRLKDVYEHSQAYEQQTDRQRQAYDWKKDQQIRDVITALSRFEGLEIELCGTWIYVRGNTYPYRKELKALGLGFNKHKGCWIIYFDDYYQYHKNPVSMSYIRDKYGSVIIRAEDSYLFMVSAIREDGTYAVWTVWNETTQYLNYGHYALQNVEDCEKVFAEFYNDGK